MEEQDATTVDALLMSASANHDRLKRLEDVIASMSAAADKISVQHKTSVRPVEKKADKAKGVVTKSFLIAWRPVLVCAPCSHRCTVVYLSFHPIGQKFTASVTEACARRPGAAASVSHRRRERRTLLAGGGRRASRSHTLAASQALERMHTLSVIGLNT